MKIIYRIKSKSIINRFGNAWLIRGSNGKTALVGGTAGDFTEAKEWVSLFAHDVVFSRSNNAIDRNRALDKSLTRLTHFRLNRA